MSRRRSVFETSHVAHVHLKQQEESLSNEIDQNLRTIAFFHPLSDIADSVLVKDAFTKANKPAFHCIVHYLIIIINVVEFRKRFRWPITTSRDETDFRNAALTFFNECHTNFKWNFGPFKMQVVLFPGGVEFMKIIVELTKIAMRSILKENDSLLMINAKVTTLREAQARLQAAEEAYKEMEKFCSKVQDLAVPLTQRTCRLKEVLRDVLHNTSITEKILDQGFLTVWETNQRKTIDEIITPSLRCLEYFVSKCESFEEKLITVKPQQLRFDKDKLHSFELLQMSEHFNPKIDYDKLLARFECTIPHVIDTINFKPPWSVSQLKAESEMLDQILQRIHSLSMKADAITFYLPLEFNSKAGINGTGFVSNSINYWYEKLMLTPKMRCPLKKNVRIAIWEAIPAVFSPAGKIQYNSMPFSDDTSGFSDRFGSVNSTAMRTISTKLDPMSMLNKAMNRKKRFNKTTGSPRRISFISSPSRLSNNHQAPFNSTMINAEGQFESPRSRINHIYFSPLRESSF